MNILFLAEAVSFAHVGRPLTLANWAHQNGHEVHFACSLIGLRKTGTTNFAFPCYQLNTIDSDLFYGRIKKGQFFYSYDEMLGYVEEEKKLINQINPDLVVTDFRLTAPISTRICNKPLINLANSHWSPNTQCPFPAPKTGFFQWIPPIVQDGIFSLIRPIAFKVYAKELNKVRRNYGLPEKNDFRELYTEGTYTAFMDMPDFSILENKPKHHIFLGPVIWNPEIKKQNIQLDSKDNIYISMGSSGNNKHLDAIIKSILKTTSRIILSGISPQEKIDLIEKHPELINRSVIESLIDTEKILPNCRLTVCHGGSGTVYQSLSYGVPALCFPDNPDQHLVSYSVKRQNLGDWIPQNKSTVKRISKSILECLNNKSLITNAFNYAERIRSQNTCQKWLQFLTTFAPMPKPIRPSGVSIAFNQANIKQNEIKILKKPSEFTIKLATTLEEREETFRLAYKVYLEKGYIKSNYNELAHIKI
jgi:UDP:flavonoid glycosyltransferase YjiC (YdhE family)